MIDKLNSHYSMTNPASIYDEESLTALELAGRTASKVNEVVDLVNKNEKTVNDAKTYMTDNLPVFVENNINEMNENGTLDKIASTAVASGKVDKNGVGQVNYQMLSQDVREMFTGGNTAVVGANSVSTENIVAHSVDMSKLKLNLLDMFYASTATPENETPYFNIDRATGTITKQRTDICALFNKQFTVNLDFATVTIANHVDLTSVSNVNLFFDKTNNILHFYKLEASQADSYKDFYNLGLINLTYPYATNCIVPFSIDTDLIFNPNRIDTREHYFLECQYSGAASLTGDIHATVDWTNRKLIIPPASYIYAMGANVYETLYSGAECNNGLEIPFPENASTYTYLVGGKGGVKFLEPKEMGSVKGRFADSEHYYFGFIHIGQKRCELNMRVNSGRTLSILGDSISTFAGYIPEGNEVYYTGNNCGLSNVRQTWWGQLMNNRGFVLNTNNSWSGSRVTTMSTAGKDGITRATLLDNGTHPDVIIVYLGINDFNHGVAIGTYNGRGPIPTSTTTFREGYANMLKRLLSKYTSTKVYCCTLPNVERTTANITDPESNSNGVYLTEFNDAIREIARAFCVEVIDLECCGITHYNASVVMGDYNTSTGQFTHPNVKGHNLIADKMLRTITEIK